VLDCFVADPKDAIPVHPLQAAEAKDLSHLPHARWRRWAEASGFEGKAGQLCLVPDAEGGLEAVLAGYDPQDQPWAFAELPAGLPAGHYVLKGSPDPWSAAQSALGWALAHYSFARYKKQSPPKAKLVWPQGVDRSQVLRLAAAVGLVRDLINTPAEDMGPSALAEAALEVGRTYGATAEVIVGDALLRKNFPLVHTVGRAAADPPRLVVLRWGDTGPHLALVG